jgi:hypothetical protein
MELSIVRIYLGELNAQAKMAGHAFTALAINQDRMDTCTPESGRDYSVLHSEHFRSAHSFLTHCSNISKLLWPPKIQEKTKPKACECRECKLCRSRFAQHRALTLRKAIGLDGKKEHVLQDRTLRDHLEHFDERLDKWQRTSKRRNYFQDCIGSPEIFFEGIDNGDMMRFLDPPTGDFVFQGKRYGLVSLMEGVDEVSSKISAVIDRYQ